MPLKTTLILYISGMKNVRKCSTMVPYDNTTLKSKNKFCFTGKDYFSSNVVD